MQQRDSTLHARPGFDRPRNERPFSPRRDFKPRAAKGHDALLKDLQESGAPVRLVLSTSGNAVIGKIVARDKFTVSVLRDDGSEFPLVIYKHALETFEQIGKAPSAPQGQPE